ncbi:MAG: N-acetyltransferase family protein [Flavobacteriales bacterium]
MEPKIRPAQVSDVSAIFGLIQELAIYEKAPEQVSNTENQLSIDLFDKQLCEAIVAEIDSEIIGFALYYTSYSTWKGACLYLEDFYVKESKRKLGVGQLLFDEVLRVAKRKQVKRMDWQVLDWNEPAIRFYQKQHAILDPEWLNGRLFFE